MHRKNAKKNTQKKINNSKNKSSIERLFNKFLQKHAVDKGEELTHTAFGPPWGRYNIPDNSIDEFYTLYYNALQKQIPVHIVERPKTIGPLLIDIDFDMDTPKRKYTDADIVYIIKMINSVVREYYKWTGKSLQAFVSEKQSPTKKVSKSTQDIRYKDGFHIMYPYLALNDEMRHYIIYTTKEKIKEKNGFAHIAYTNEFDTIFDTSVITNNGWMMYGSKKYDGQYYFLTKIYDCKYKEKNITEYKNQDLVWIMSNRKLCENDLLQLKDTIDQVDLAEEILHVLEETGAVKKPKPNNNQFDNYKVEYDSDYDDINDSDSDSDSESSEEKSADMDSIRSEIMKTKKKLLTKEIKIQKKMDINIARELTSVLSIERATAYKTWIRVCWALYNISPSLLNTFKEFSSRAPNYDKHACEREWNKTSYHSDGLTMGTLKFWAEDDNPQKYHEIILKNINKYLTEAESGTEYDVAKFVFELYKDKYRCSIGERHDKWYEFQKHRWVYVEGGYTLNKKLSEDVAQEFAIQNSIYMKQMFSKGKRNKKSESNNKLEKANNILKIIGKLKKDAFKMSVMKQCKILFHDYDPNFCDKLDANPDLIGFDNGVYDLKEGLFRSSCPDDYVTMSVGFEYENYDMNHPYIAEINTFFAQVQRETIMKNYIFKLLARFLDGYVNDEEVLIWTGTGCHGIGTQIRMYDSSLKSVEDIKIGNVLLGDDKTPRIVRHLYRGQDKLYNVRQHDKSDYVVNSEHRLALQFIGKKEILPHKNGFKVVYYIFDQENGIIKQFKYFNVVDAANKFYNELDNNKNQIPYDHKICITVNSYLKLNEYIREKLVGYDINSNKLNIDIKYMKKGDYYGFELSGNQKYVLADGTITMNSNGKSKTVELFQNAFGDYCCVAPSTVLTRKSGKSNEASPEIAEFKGKRFIVLQEPEGTDTIQVGRMKEYSGGDIIKARPLFGDPIEFRPQFMMVLVCNNLPDIPSTDGGTWRRLHVTPWESKFISGQIKYDYQFKKDRNLREKLERWAKVFLWYLINYWYPIYKKDGIKSPPKVTKFTNKYKKDSDIFYEFIDAQLTITGDANDTESWEVLFAAFKHWYKEAYTKQCSFNKKDLVEYFNKNEYMAKKRFLHKVKFADEDEDEEQRMDFNALDA